MSFTLLVLLTIEGKATLIFPRLPHGSYAVIVFHDENGNDDLDHNFMRFPAEPLGCSNGFKLTLFSGVSNFKRLCVTLEDDTVPL